MSNYKDTADVLTEAEPYGQRKEGIERKTFLDYFSLAISTFGVGFIPLAPGTWGSAIGVLIYLFVRESESKIIHGFSNVNLPNEITVAWIVAFNAIAILLFCFLGMWAASRAAQIFQTEDPQKVVVDEVMGQLIVFLFVPFDVSWQLVLTGFVLFRLFDIWKPYPIDSLENLPSGIGVCADDIMAGVYGGICLALLYAVQVSL